MPRGRVQDRGEFNKCGFPDPRSRLPRIWEAAPAYGTFQVPAVWNPVLAVAVYPKRNTVFAPVNAGLKVSAEFTVRTLPTLVTLEPEPFRVHWLFCNVAPLPG